MNKLDFLQHEYLVLLAGINEHEKPIFGKMNVHQMIEHMSYAVRQAYGLIPLPAAQDEETTAKMYRFMMSDKPFRDNTPNPFLPDEPEPVKQATIAEAIAVLKNDIAVFVDTFTKQPELRVLNPFFGNLNMEEWIHLLHKHAWHHLRQFNINP